MRCSVTVPNFGEFAGPETFVEIGELVERAGWDALFVWDHVVEQLDARRRIADPWVLLSAAAGRTVRVRGRWFLQSRYRAERARLARRSRGDLVGRAMPFGDSVGLVEPVRRRIEQGPPAIGG